MNIDEKLEVLVDTHRGCKHCEIPALAAALLRARKVCAVAIECGEECVCENPCVDTNEIRCLGGLLADVIADTELAGALK